MPLIIIRKLFSTISRIKGKDDFHLILSERLMNNI